MTSAVLSRPKERAPYQPFGASRLAWRSHRPELLLCGPADTGKSRSILEKLHYCADKYPNARLLMVRKTRTSLSQTAMVTYEKKVLPHGWLGKLIRFNTTEQQYEYPNGSIIAVGGMDNAEKVLSSEWDMIYAQEATELNENDWEILGMRLRNGAMPYQQLLGDCNPGPPTHWLKRRCDRHATHLLNSRHEDNPSITPDRVARLKALTGVRYERYYLGRWAAAEGMVYEEWNRPVHLVTHAHLVAWNILYSNGSLNRTAVRHVLGAADWGYTNPGCLQVYAIDYDGRMYQLCEVYRTKRTIDWWIAQAHLLTQEFGIEHWACDPSEPAYIQQFNTHGLHAKGASNEIVPGINYLATRLKPCPDGRPRFCVYEYALRERDETLEQAHKPYCFEQEIDAYVWPQAKDGKPVKEVPVDENNHALDTARYAVAHVDAGLGEMAELDSDLVTDLNNYRGY